MTPTEIPHHYTAEDLHNPDVAHEHKDVNVRAILMFGVGMVVVAVVSAIVVWIFFGVLERQAAANDPPRSPVALPEGQLPALPRLQDDEPGALRKFRAMEAKTLEGYGWIDEKAGVAHIPIDEAKKRLLERGLPVRAGAPLEDRAGTHAPAMGESSGGRSIRK